MVLKISFQRFVRQLKWASGESQPNSLICEPHRGLEVNGLPEFTPVCQLVSQSFQALMHLFAQESGQKEWDGAMALYH